jgi:hypothetical protein
MGECMLEMVRHHRILGLILDEKLNWKEPLKNVKARASKKLNLLKTLDHKEWGRGRGFEGGSEDTAKKIHQMFVLSTLRYSETIYGSVSKAALRTIEPVHHKGVQIAQGVFVICKTENALCEAGLPTHTEMWELNTTIVATRILTNSDHPIRHFFMDHKIQEEYAMKTSIPQPIFMKAIETFGKQEIDVRKVETTPAYTRPPWLVNENETIDLTMCVIPKGVSRERIQAEFTSLIVDKYGEHNRIYTDGRQN